MKKTRIVLVGALVLALAFVMGCAQEAPTTDESIGEATQKGWIVKDQKNDTKQYWRWMRGTGKKYENATMQLDMSDANAGKIGFVFGLTEGVAADGKGNGKWSYYQFGVGIGKAGTKNAGKYEYYIDYYTNVDLNKVSGGSNSYGPEGVVPKEVVKPTAVDIELLDPKELKVFVKMVCDKKNGYTLMYGLNANAINESVHSGYLTDGAKDSKGEYMYSDVGYYAMLTQASAEKPVTSTFEYTLVDSKTSLTAAAEEE